VPRRVEPDPQGWWERYGHRLKASSAGEHVGEQHRHTAGELTDDMIVRRRADVPGEGWRRLLHLVTGGLVNPGPSEVERTRRELVHRLRRPLSETHRVAVTSIKGGVGKTTVATCLGLALAEHRGDRVVVLDANPDAGTLADRLTGESAVTVRELLRDLDRIHSWADVTRYTSLAGRLQVLASEQDPASSDAFSREEYEHISELLARFFNIVITDSGTGLVHSAMEGTLKLADSVIIVGAPTVDGASRASKTLDWLLAHGHPDLARASVVVLSCDRTSVEVDAARIREHFAARCRAVVEIPHDPHLATGGRVELARLRPATRDAFLGLAALIADRFDRSLPDAAPPYPGPPPPGSPPPGSPPPGSPPPGPTGPFPPGGGLPPVPRGAPPQR
jgi:MinD-like ATPase involved in chromosome partitioning or flagellar assembly